MKTVRTQFKIAGKVRPFVLYPLPVIEGSKFLILTQSHREAIFLQKLLAASWLELDPANPTTIACHWIELERHTDGVTRQFQMQWKNLHLNYIPRQEVQVILKSDQSQIDKIESTLSKQVGRWAAEDFAPQSEIFKKIEQTIENQKTCSSCRAKGIGLVNFDILLG